MPSVRPAQLVDAILDAISQSGEATGLVSAVRTHPRRFAVSGPHGAVILWVYAWTLTPGGRPQLADEYRIQMTSVTSPLPLNPDGPTLLIGYEPSLNVFGGFDISRHRTFTIGSPSVQISLSSLQQALQDGMAFYRKQNEEITVAFRPDDFMVYARNAPALHRAGRSLPAFRMLARASTRQSIPETALANLNSERRRVVQTISRVSRDRNFSDQVLHAYDRRCAVTRLQLRLLDAAHVVPVDAPGSPDHVTNGIALSPTYHRAFGHGLIYLDENHTMRINQSRMNVLAQANLVGGLDAFRAPLGRIHLPSDARQWPDPRFIRRANTYRHIEM